jgi:hypothetical protein
MLNDIAVSAPIRRNDGKLGCHRFKQRHAERFLHVIARGNEYYPRLNTGAFSKIRLGRNTRSLVLEHPIGRLTSPAKTPHVAPCHLQRGMAGKYRLSLLKARRRSHQFCMLIAVDDIRLLHYCIELVEYRDAAIS